MAAENKPIEEAVTEVTETTENADLLRMEEILVEVTKAKEDIDEAKRKVSEQLTKALNCVEIVKNVKASITDTEKTIDAKLTALQKTEAKLLSVSKETEKQLSKIEKQTDELKKRGGRYRSSSSFLGVRGGVRGTGSVTHFAQ